MIDFNLVLGDEFNDRLLSFTFIEDECMELHDTGKRNKVPIKYVRVGNRVLSTF